MMSGVSTGNAHELRDEENALNNLGGNRSRHSTHQRQKLEEFFQNCTHPDERQRHQLSEELGLEPKQIKFWFQNRRTQIKTLNERAEIDALKLEKEKIIQEKEKLIQENLNMQEELKKLLILRNENVKLKLELERVSRIVENIKGQKVTDTPLFPDTVPISENSIPEVQPSWLSLGVETEGGDTLVDVSHMMIKNFWDKLYVSLKPYFPHMQNKDIKMLVLDYDVSACSTLCLSVSREVLFEFLVDEKSRSQWDIFTDERPMKKTADLSFGSHPEIRVSIFQPSSLSNSSMSILQASYEDALGSVIIYAPIPGQWIRSLMRGEDSNIPTLPVGFLISENKHSQNPGDVASTSSSCRMGGGSILTMLFQNSMETNSTPITTIITSTMEKIKAALNC